MQMYGRAHMCVFLRVPQRRWSLRRATCAAERAWTYRPGFLGLGLRMFGGLGNRSDSKHPGGFSSDGTGCVTRPLVAPPLPPGRHRFLPLQCTFTTNPDCLLDADLPSYPPPRSNRFRTHVSTCTTGPHLRARLPAWCQFTLFAPSPHCRRNPFWTHASTCNAGPQPRARRGRAAARARGYRVAPRRAAGGQQGSGGVGATHGQGVDGVDSAGMAGTGWTRSGPGGQGWDEDGQGGNGGIGMDKTGTGWIWQEWWGRGGQGLDEDGQGGNGGIRMDKVETGFDAVGAVRRGCARWEECHW
eukprot:350832-Chlamydomonas_euryale.AAC.2